MTFAKKLLKIEKWIMDKNERFLNEENFPVCRFGPGGDFVTDWPYTVSKKLRRPIASLLKTIAKMLDAVITEELLNSSTLEKINLAINGSNLTIDSENEIDADKSDESNAPAASGIKAGGQLQTQPMLFDNASGIGGPAGHKPNHSVRAHRRVKRKRTAFSQPWQGSLFESYPQSAKVA
jgi:hypothetical protein